MAATRLSDLVIATEIFARAVELRTLNTNAFLTSGVAIQDPEINAFLNSAVGGNTFSPRYIGPLPDTDPNISSDDPSTSSTPNKISAIKNTCVRQSLNNSWSSMDLNMALFGEDPLNAVANQIGDYWSTVMTKRLLASLKGVIADNVANDSSDMVVDVSTETSPADQIFNPDAFIDTQATLGDLAGNLTGIAVHSHVYATMRKQDLIDFIKPSDGLPLIATYMGLPLIVDDAMTVVTTAGANAVTTYYTYLFGAGAVAMGIGTPRVPYEIDRKPDAGNGGGQETLYSRQELVIHPQGFKFAKTTTPTITELETATNWDRAFERKRVPLACLITKG